VTDLEASEEQADPEASGGVCRSCGLGCLGIVVLASITFGAFTYRASNALDLRFDAAAAEVEERMAPEGRRRTVVGEPDNDDSAVVFYNGFLWALAGGQPEGRLPYSWRHQAPQLPTDIGTMLAEVSPEGKAIDGVETGFLSCAWEEPGQELSAQEAERFQRGERAFARFRPALRYLRRGLRCGRSDWETRWDRGYRIEDQNGLYLRAGANLLAYEAVLQTPQEALQTGLEIVAWGQDVARRGTEFDTTMGIAIVGIGCESLVYTLARPGLSPEDCRTLCSALSSFSLPDPGSVLRGARLQFVVSLLEVSGRPLAPDEEGPIYFNDMLALEPGGLPYLDVVFERQLSVYEDESSRNLGIVDLPLAKDRAALGSQLHAEAWERNAFPRSSQIPSAGAHFNHLRTTLAFVRIVQTIAAARAVQLETGEFPESSAVLAETLGAAHTDPCAEGQPAPLGYQVQGKVLEVWCAGNDGVNQGAPPPPRAKKARKKKGKKKGGQAKATGGKKKKRKGPARPQSDDRGFRFAPRGS